MIKLTGFAEDCYNKRSLERLIKDMRSKSSNKADCKKWKLSETEWRDALWLAFLKRLKNMAEGIPIEMQTKLPYKSNIRQDLQWLTEF